MRDDYLAPALRRFSSSDIPRLKGILKKIEEMEGGRDSEAFKDLSTFIKACEEIEDADAEDEEPWPRRHVSREPQSLLVPSDDRPAWQKFDWR